jgi:hypothetical protein
MTLRELAADAGVELGNCASIEDFETSRTALGKLQVRTIISNSGPAGEVKVVIEALRDKEVVLERFTRTVKMGGDSTRQEKFIIEAPDATSYVGVSAEAKNTLL